MTITKSAYTPTHRRPPTLYFFAKNELNVAAFDLLNWEGSRERIVSAWKLLTSEILTERQKDEGEEDEVLLLYNSVEKDMGEATALHAVDADESGSDEREVNEWYQAYITLADNYGFYRWPELALTDYLRGFEGYDEARAKVTAQRAWETARMVYDARKPAEEKPTKKAKKKAA